MLKHLMHFWTSSLERVKRNFWLLVGYQSSQVGMQAMNFVIGILIIRSMPKNEYAAYTIITTLVPVMLILSDTGIVTGIWAIGRRVWEDNDKTGRLVTTALQLRRRLAMICFFVVGPFLAWMLFRNQVPTLTLILLMFFSLSAISFQLTGAILNTVLGLRQVILSIER